MTSKVSTTLQRVNDFNARLDRVEAGVNNLVTELADAKQLLARWVETANIARDLTFAPIASATEAFLRGNP